MGDPCVRLSLLDVIRSTLSKRTQPSSDSAQESTIKSAAQSVWAEWTVTLLDWSGAFNWIDSAPPGHARHPVGDLRTGRHGRARQAAQRLQLRLHALSHVGRLGLFLGDRLRRARAGARHGHEHQHVVLHEHERGSDDRIVEQQMHD